jgi:hypothetical protein
MCWLVAAYRKILANSNVKCETSHVLLLAYTIENRTPPLILP